MTAAFLRIDAHPHIPARARAIVTMAGLGLLTGLISCVPSPLPDIRWDEPEILINARTIPLHAGIAFGAMLAGVTWLWLTRDRLKCLLVFAFGLAAWLVAVNTASEVFSNIVASELFGTKPGAKDNREILGLLVGGLAGGAAGSGLVTFGLGFATPQIRRMQSALPIVATGTVLGLLLYPAADLDVLPLLLVPWQTLVAAAIAYALTLPKT
ncbi:MAG TPA: hypothetical protein VIG26_09730 [Methyloceanibacter sp.]|jgi:hypothetical protein